MEENDKRQLEGLLQARSEDIRHGVRSRRRLAQPPVFQVETVTGVSADVSSAPRCEACGAEIGARRLRAMPRATLCLHCRRSADRAETPT